MLEKAINWVNYELSISPKDFFYLLKIYLLQSHSQKEEAISTINKVQAIYPRNKNFYRVLMRQTNVLNDFKEIITVLKGILIEFPV